MVLGDLVYAGILKEPSVARMAELIDKLNMGGKKGLEKVGYILSEVTSAIAFQETYQYLEKHLTQNEQVAIGFNPIVLEHTLCKYQRVYRKIEKL